jgi:hypothetical protein
MYEYSYIWFYRLSVWLLWSNIVAKCILVYDGVVAIITGVWWIYYFKYNKMYNNDGVVDETVYHTLNNTRPEFNTVVVPIAPDYLSQ